MYKKTKFQKHTKKNKKAITTSFLLLLLLYPHLHPHHHLEGFFFFNHCQHSIEYLQWKPCFLHWLKNFVSFLKRKEKGRIVPTCRSSWFSLVTEHCMQSYCLDGKDRQTVVSSQVLLAWEPEGRELRPISGDWAKITSENPGPSNGVCSSAAWIL